MKKKLILVFLIYFSTSVTMLRPSIQNPMHSNDDAYKELLSLVQTRMHQKHDLNNPDPSYAFIDTLLIRSVRNGQNFFEITQLLLENGADPNIANVYGDTALIIATFNYDLKTTQLLLEKNADPNAIGMFKCTPLFQICFSFSSDTLESHNAVSRAKIALCLLKAGASPNFIFKNRSILHELLSCTFKDNKSFLFQNLSEKEVFIKQRKALIQLIIEYGGNILAKDQNNKTPLDLAHTNDYNLMHKKICFELADYALQLARTKLKALLHDARKVDNNKPTSFLSYLPEELVRQVLAYVYPP